MAENQPTKESPKTDHKGWAAAFGAVVTGLVVVVVRERFGVELDPVMKEALTVVITGAGGVIAYVITYHVANLDREDKPK